MFLPIILPANQNYPSTTPTGLATPPAINNNSTNQFRQQQQLVKYENLYFIYILFLILF